MLKLSHGQKYTLETLNYDTPYPESVPICKATSLNIVKELVLLFSWVGISKEILNTQGMALKLNEVFDSYPITRVDELIGWLVRAHYISILDLSKGYWQVALAPSTHMKTTNFSTVSGHWQYQVLLFGLYGAPATFQQLRLPSICTVHTPLHILMML